jgi:hypothetical protein
MGVFMHKPYAKIRRVLAALFCFAALLLSSCPQEGGNEMPFEIVYDVTAKYQPDSLPGLISRAACYIDTEKYSPLNVMDYRLADTGTLYFDYVVLGSAELKRGTNGVYIHIPPSLKALLEKRFTYIVPLQKQGIRVLLGLKGGHDGVTFGVLSDEDRDDLAAGLAQQIAYYGLTGVELWDIDGAKSASECPYPTGTHILADGSAYTVPEPDDPAEAEQMWLDGGGQMANFLLKLRSQITLSIGGMESDDMSTESFDKRIILVREQNFASWMPEDIPIGVFVTLYNQFNFTVNSDFASFGSDSTTPGFGNYRGTVDPGHSALDNLLNWQYAPLAVNFDPGPGQTVIPPLEDTAGASNDIFTYSTKFREGLSIEMMQYNLIYYQNLRSLTEAESGSALTIPASLASQYPGKVKLTQAEYMSITSQAVFGENVICTGGDYFRDW